MIPTHGEVIELAKALQVKYLHGEALIHISANLGTRANETFLLTASEAVFKKGQGNYIDTKNWNALVHWQVNDDPNKAYKTTKNKKNRAVHIPSVEVIYSDIAIAAFGIAIIVDLFVFKNSLLTRLAFWLSYMIILPFQLLTNWWLTHNRSDGNAIVMYDPDSIIGIRIASAPIEDLLFGFALVLSVMGMWEFWGRRGFQRNK
jgi:lycopene cyclase domain-containing protein